MNLVLFILITFAFLHLVHNENNECISSRKWQIGNTIYENQWFNNELYVHARCSIWGQRLNGREWNLCTDGHIGNNLPECLGSKPYRTCLVGNKWHASNTEYEVILRHGGLIVVAKCNQPDFVIDGAQSIPCGDYINQQSLPQCRNGSVRNQFEACAFGRKWSLGNYKFENLWENNKLFVSVSCVRSGVAEHKDVILCKNGEMQNPLPDCETRESNVCVYGKKWHANNTEYEIFEYNIGLIVVAKCVEHRFHIGGNTWSLCEQGRIPTTLPQCTFGRVQCSALPDPSNGKKSCSANAPRVGSYCNFTCGGTHYLKGSRRRHCSEENLQWTGNPVRCIIRPECSTPLPLVNGTVGDCSPQKILRFGDSCNFRCNAGLILVGPSTLTCRINGKLMDSKGFESIPKCVYVTDPCANANGNCSHNCRNINGDVQCYCHDGYRLDENGMTCTDVNECAENTHECEHLCLNTEGSYKCQCKTGYKLESRFKCKEIAPTIVQIIRKSTLAPQHNLNPCYRQNGGCTHKCKVTSGQVKCSCEAGYQLANDRKTCQKINPIPAPTNPERKVEAHTTNTFNSLGGSRIINPIYRNTCNFDNGGCKQICKEENGIAQCNCHKGYELQRDNKTCKDTNECLFENFGCSDTCINTQGDAYCTCKKGFELKHDGKHCTDIDECGNEALNNCDQKCDNIKGGYTCSCFPGYILINDFKCEGCRKNSYRSSSDAACVDCPPNSHTNSEGKTSLNDCLCNRGFYGNISKDEPCRDVNECDSGNFGCSENCINTMGSAYCSCPQGFQLQEDQKTCSDIDECRVKNGGCQGICHNSIGSFRCSCVEGYTISATDSYLCDDVDECQENNGGCSEECANFLGGYQCTCPGQSHLGGDGKTCQTLYCPEVPVPYYSRLTCFHKNNKTVRTEYDVGKTSHSAKLPVATICKLKCDRGYTIEESLRTIICLSNGIWNTTAGKCKVSQCPPLKAPENGDVHPPECKLGSRTVNDKCYFTCNGGYRMKANKTVFKCQNRLQWNYKKIPNCEPEQITPAITCPSDVTIDLLPNENSSRVILRYPETNMEDMQVFPDWVDFERPIAFPAGKTDIIVVARSPNFKNLTTNCTLSVTVLDKEYPEFIDCPETMDVSGGSVDGAVVYWKEPLAVDNIGIKSIIRNAEPNSTWFPGIHIVEYIAEDFAGNIARCSFEINVTSVDCGDLADPENGEANCLDWVYGKLCEPSCHLNYTRGDDDAQFYMCDDTGTWTPNNVISPCLPECEYEEIWSQEFQMCVDIGMNATDTYSE